MSWRRLTVLVEHMPYQQATRIAMGDTDGLWGLQELLLAAAIDQLRVANWQRGGGKGSRPKPLPRPGLHAGKSEARRIGNTRDLNPVDVGNYLRQFGPRRDDGG